MKETILGEIYSSLSKEELKKFNKYMKFSEWSDSPTILRCHELYSHYIKEKDILNFNKTELFNYIYPGEKYNDSKLRFTQNRLLNAIKQFIINYEFEKENIFASKIWMDFLLEKKLKKNLQYHTQEKKIIANSDYRYLNEYFKSQEESYIAFQNPKNQENQYQTIQNVISKAQLFSDLVFIRNFCSLLTFGKTFKSIPFKLPIDALDNIKSRTNIDKYPEFRVYFSAIKLIEEGSEEAYLEYKNNLFQSLLNWEDQEKINLIVYLLNFTTQQINQGNASYFNEQYDLFLKLEQHKIFEIKNYINPARINNMVIVFLRNKDFQKAEDVVHKYIEYLKVDVKDSCRHFNLARIKFEKNQYKDSLRELLQVDFSKDAFYSLNSKVLLIKNYFELNEIDALDSLLISFKEFIKKNKVISDIYRTNYLNFVSMTRQLYYSKPMKLKQLKKEVLDSHNIPEKEWILHKIENLLTK